MVTEKSYQLFGGISRADPALRQDTAAAGARGAASFPDPGAEKPPEEEERGGWSRRGEGPLPGGFWSLGKLLFTP